MKPLILLLLLAAPCFSQELDWKLIKEMSGEIPNHPGLTVKTSAAQIARGNNLVKVMMKAEFPWGSPRIEGATYPHGFDVSSISQIVFRIEFNCDTLIVKPVTGSADIYQFNGKKLKSKEAPISIPSGHIFAQYFCEQGSAPTVAPKLKPIQ